MMPRDSLPERTSAAILQFPRRRGRPKTIRPQRDSGTPELAIKRRMGETAEALDLCLERGIITERQHWCGVHLRWLYTLRHGVPSVRAVDPTHISGREMKPDDPDWRHAREKEYHDAIRKLAGRGHAALVSNLCIYNERPLFLRFSKQRPMKKSESDAIFALREGLDLLAAHWKRPSKDKI